MGQPVQMRTKRVERVKVGGVDIFAELDSGGPQPAGIGEVLSFDGVRETVEAIARELVQAWDCVKPTEVSVEFALSLTARSGKLMGLLVDGAGSGSLKVTLTWKAVEAD